MIKKWLFLWLALLALASCAGPKEIAIVVDGERQEVETRAGTVREALEEAGVTLGSLDRVEPDLWEVVEEGTEIVVTRVEEREEVKVLAVPFQREVIEDEALEVGERRLMRKGRKGQEEVTYRITFEDGKEAAREVVARRVIEEPVSKVVVVGAKGLLPSVPISGTIAYISHGNAWVMRHESGQKRPLTTTGDLDGWVFALSPDGTRLLFTHALTTSLNSLWVVSTVVVGDEPRPLGVEGVRYAQWSWDGKLVAYSTAERTEGVPGWRAKNDLYILSLESGAKREVLPPSSGGLYGWWGANFAWSPRGDLFAYADADEIGLIDPQTGQRSDLFSFPPYLTYSDWVWVPPLSWSTDGRFLATVIYDGEGFDLWALGVDGFKARLASGVGLWAAPIWSPYGSLLFGRAEEHDINSPYHLYLMDTDGSNERQVFPPEGQEGLAVEQLPPWVWSPWGEELIFLREGSLYLLSLADGSGQRLTMGGGASHPQWSR